MHPAAGRTPISPEKPTGEDPRSTPEYEELQAHISLIGSLRGGEVPWERVALVATTILEKQAKDINSAVYLTAALAETQGAPGWCEGSTVLADILELWWDAAFPVRPRARANILVWWHERSRGFFERQGAALPAEQHRALLALLERMDSLLGQRVPDNPPIFDLIQSVKVLPVLPEAPTLGAAPAADASSGADATSGGTSTTPPYGATASGNETSGATAPPPPPPGSASATPAAGTPQKAETVGDATSATQPARPSPAPMPTGEAGTGNAADLDAARAGFRAAARHYYAQAFSGVCPTDPLAWNAFFIHLWGSIQAVPAAENGITRIPAPDSERFAVVETLIRSGKAPQAALTVAMLAPESPLCLDLLRLLDQALRDCGAAWSQPLHMVRAALRDLLQRLPGIEELAFADERPFADAATRVFLRDLCTEHGAAATDETAQAIQTILDLDRNAAQPLALSLTQLDEAPARSGADRLRMRLAQIRLLAGAQRWEAVEALAADVESTLESKDLATWDRPLCLQARTALYEAFAVRADEAGQVLAARQAHAVARLSPAASLPLWKHGTAQPAKGDV